jgi:hypothetical protein
MPEATAQLINPANEQPIKIDDRLNQIRQSVGANADMAIGNKGSTHNPVPFPEREIPIHVPTGSAKTTHVSEKKGYVAPPDTFQKPKSNLFNHMVHGEDWTGNADKMTEEMNRRNDLAMAAKNSPTPRKGIVSNFVDWLHDKKAA